MPGQGYPCRLPAIDRGHGDGHDLQELIPNLIPVTSGSEMHLGGGKVGQSLQAAGAAGV